MNTAGYLTVRAHILEAVEVFDAYRSYETSESPNLLDVPSDLPFSRNFQQDFEIRKSKHLAGNDHNADCYLAKVEKIRIDAATSCKDREFRCLARCDQLVVWIVSFPQKVLGFRKERKPRAFWNYCSKPSI